jgi:signal transduction histidine kinase
MTMKLAPMRRWISPPVLSAAASLIVFAAALVLLSSRFLYLAALNGHSHLPNDPPFTTVGLVLAAVALALLRKDQPSIARRLIAIGLGTIVCLLGLIALLGYIVDAVWFPYRPPFYAAVVFFVIGSSLSLLDVRPPRGPQPAQLLALIALHICVLAVLGQLFNNPMLYLMATAADSGMSVPMALLGIVLSIGILSARPNWGFTAVVRGTGAGGLVARRLLLAPIGVFLAVFLIVWVFGRAGIISRGFGGWLFTTSYFTAFTLLIWWVASVIRRTKRERDLAEAATRGLNEDLERRVAERTTELSEANRHLALWNQENETFVYSVSHDLRSPLVNLQGFSKELETVSREVHALLADDRLPTDVRQRGQALIDGDMAESICFIQTAVLRLSAIIDALLRLSRAGRVQYRMQAVDLNATVHRVVGALHGTIHERGARVTTSDLPAAWGDATAVEQVFANLVGNALNYLDPKRPGEIEIGVTRQQAPETLCDGRECQVYHVRDNGLGIPDTHRFKLFRAFHRFHPDAAPGEGMGLAIVHRIVERHGGKLWLNSTPGAGTTFFVALPATAAAHHNGIPK